MLEWCLAEAAEIPPSPKSRKSRPNPDVATAAAAAVGVKQEDVTKGDTGEATEAAKEVKAETEADDEVERSPAVSSDVVGVEDELLFVVLPPLCNGGGGTLWEWLTAELTCNINDICIRKIDMIFRILVLY